MNLVQFEVNKIVKKRLSLIVLLITILLFPVLVKGMSVLMVDEIPEGLFVKNVAYQILSISQSYFFLPIWIIIFAGLEFSNGHVNKVAFIRSRKFYLHSKLVYSGLITILFSTIGLVALIISIKTSPFQQLYIVPGFYFNFFLQIIFTTFCYSILLLSLVFIFRSPIIAFVVYLGWSFVESILYHFIGKIFQIDFFWLPLYLIKSLYSKTGNPLNADDYYNPFIENLEALLMPFGFTMLLILTAYTLFPKSDIKPLSD